MGSSDGPGDDSGVSGGGSGGPGGDSGGLEGLIRSALGALRGPPHQGRAEPKIHKNKALSDR